MTINTTLTDSLSNIPHIEIIFLVVGIFAATLVIIGIKLNSNKEEKHD